VLSVYKSQTSKSEGAKGLQLGLKDGGRMGSVLALGIALAAVVMLA
jgi:hypothetical protein